MKAKRYNKVSLNELEEAVHSNGEIDISNQDAIDANKITVIKRNGSKELYQPNKMRNVCLWACDNKDWLADELIEDTEIKLHKEIHIKDMFQQLIVTAVNKISLLYPHWEMVAAKLQLMSIYKETYNISTLNDYTNMNEVIKKGLDHKIYDRITVELYTSEELEVINTFIEPSRDLLFNYKGLVTFFDKYCLNYSKTKKLELPQHTYMRVAMALMVQEDNRLQRIKEMYDALSLHNYTCATPIMLNSLTPGQQLSSCVLNTVSDDSHNILDTGKNLGIYSKYKGGTALDASALRAKGSYIEGTQGYSSGPVSFMKFYESIMKAWNQGGKRPGALCVYFNWWHMDINDILSLKSNGGTDENRARGLQYGIKLNQLLLDAVINDEEVTLFDPKDTPDLINVYGDAFNQTYEIYNNKSIRKKKVPARELWAKLMKERSETGNIYLVHEENVNESTLLNRYIGSSNLCLAGDTVIQTSRGEKLLEDISEGDYVYSMDVQTYKRSYKEVTDAALTNASAEVLKITDEDTGLSITCTPEHKVYTENRGYVKAKDLVPEDEFVFN